MKIIIVLQLIGIACLTLQMLTYRHQRSAALGMLMKICNEVSYKKGVVSYLTMQQSVAVMKKVLGR